MPSSTKGGKGPPLNYLPGLAAPYQDQVFTARSRFEMAHPPQPSTIHPNQTLHHPTIGSYHFITSSGKSCFFSNSSSSYTSIIITITHDGFELPDENLQLGIIVFNVPSFFTYIGFLSDQNRYLGNTRIYENRCSWDLIWP